MSENEERPWGRYEVIGGEASHKIKRIWISSGKQLSYQRHKFRAEHWFVIAGSGIAIVDGHEITITVGSSLDIAIGQLHRIRNTGNTDLIFIEVQTGTYFGEDDIVRVEDDFGRA